MVTESLVDELGGVTALARALGVKRPRVTMWKQPGRGIPAEFWIPLWCLALERGVPWAPPGGERLAALLRAGPAPASASTDLARAA
jgi:hypothetical protein